MIVAAAFCPQAPVLVPALSRGAHPELGAVTAAVGEALARVAGRADRVALLGAGPVSAVYPASARGSLRGFGLDGPDADVTLGEPATGGDVVLPVSLAVGAVLLRDAGGLDRPAVGLAVADDWAGSAAAAAAVDLRTSDVRVALVVLGDGSARRTRKAPGYLDERAAGFDAAVSGALAGGDPGALGALDPELGAELLAAGVPAWRRAGELLAGTGWQAELLHESDPFGVDYLVAAWTAPAATDG